MNHLNPFDADDAVPLVPSPEVACLAAQGRELRAEVDRLRAERDGLAETQRRIMELLGAPSPERLIHDLRNVLNERELYRALADAVDDRR